MLPVKKPAYEFKYVKAEDESVDSEFQLLNANGHDTGISIQDCRSYGGGYAVNLVEAEAITMFGERKSLKAAQSLALFEASKRELI